MAATGAWVAYDPQEKQDSALFSSEVQALRYAVERGMKVVQWPFGTSLNDAIGAR